MRYPRIILATIISSGILFSNTSIFAATKGSNWNNIVTGNQYINYYGLSEESIKLIDSNNDNVLSTTEVETFQSNNGLSSDGKFGDKTAGKLLEIQNSSLFADSTTPAAPSLSPLGAGSVGDSSVTTVDVADPDTAMDEAAALALEGVPSYEEAAAANQKALEEAMKRPLDTSTDNILGIPNNDLRNGNVDMSTIPTVLVNIINVLLGVAGTVSIVSLIYYAVQMQINSGITGDSSGVDKAKKGMYGSVIGFVVAILAWFIVIRFIEILSGLS